MARVLGLDLGSYSVKAVVLESTMRGFTVKSHHEVAMPAEGERPERLQRALAELAATPATGADQIVIALPGMASATHAVTMPFSDAKKIDATIGFEVESQLPFDLDEAVFDYQIANTDERGTNLLVGVVKKTDLSALLETLHSSKFDPRIVTHPALAFQNVLNTLPASVAPDNADDAVAIIDLGHERVTLAIGRVGGSVEAARTISGGGAALTKSLSIEFEIPLVEAQGWKEQHGAVGSEAIGADAERAAGAFLRAFHPVLRELKTTLKAYTARSRRQVGRLLLCGGTSQLRGLPEQLAQDLGIATQLLELPADVRDVLGGAQSSSVAALAYALAVRGTTSGAKAARFNLRRGEFVFKSDFDFAQDKIATIGAFAAILFVLLIASGIVRNTVLEQREKQVEAQLCDTTEKVLGKCEKNFDIALNMLKGQESPVAGLPKRTAATLLATLTTKVPAAVPFTMSRIVIDLERISLLCETDTSAHIEEVIAALQTDKCFKDVKEGKVEKSKDGTKVTFGLDIRVECPEDVPKG